MIDDGKIIIGHTKNPAHQLGGGDEVRRHHGDSRHPGTFGNNGVMQTARRATASIAKA